MNSGLKMKISVKVPNFKLVLLSLAKKIWPKVTAYALLGVLSALAAIVFKSYIPEKLAHAVGAETAGNILSILASSMLAVTTFSLSTMVTAYGSATSNVTPRATRLITEDKITQNALSTFLGTFLFSLVGIIALNMGLYEGGGRFILFLVTLAVVLLIVVTFIRWIDRLTNLGRVSETNSLIEDAASKAMLQRAHKPTFGCNRMERTPEVPADAYTVKSEQGGYVQFIDAAKLSALAEEHDVDIWVIAMPGKHVTRKGILAVCGKELPVFALNNFYKCFAIGDQRTFEQDPRFGLCVLAEVASRAMSAAVNDQGTAIDIVGRLDRVLEIYAVERKHESADFKRIWVPELCVDDLFQDAFNSFVRDAAGNFEVLARLQKTFVHLSALGEDYLAGAVKYSRILLRYSEEKLFLEEEKQKLRQIVQTLPDVLPYSSRARRDL